MKRINARIIIGTFLIAAGILFLLQTFNILPNAWNILWMMSFLVGSGIFFYIFFTDRRLWWTLIPAMTLLGLSGTIFVDSFFPTISNLGGAIFLVGLGLGFWTIYLTNHDFWWAIIPGGVLLTLGIVTLSEEYISSNSEGGVFFIGLAITFLLVALLAKPKENFWWAYIPGGVLLILGFFSISSLRPFINIIWPIALIFVGGIILLRNLRKR
jgi:hypothetical protein